MANRTLARCYATAIFTLASKAHAVEAVGNDLHAIERRLYGNDDVRRFYLSPVFERSKKAAALEAAFAGNVHEIALHSLLLFVRKRRESLLPEVVVEYDALALAAAGREPLEIVTARKLADPELTALVARLETSYGKQFEVTRRTDPALLAGMRITVGDRRIDGTLSGRLDEFARDLATNVFPLNANGTQA